MALPKDAGRLQDGRFAKGVSGNPRGRAAGTRNRATLAAMELLDGEAEALTRTAIDLALGGDMAALRLCIERIIPVRREAVDMSFQQNNVKIDLRVLSLAERESMEAVLVKMIEAQDAETKAYLERRMGEQQWGE